MLIQKGKEKMNHNITPLLDPKLRRRIIREGCESEVAIGGAGGTSHVGVGDIVVGIIVVIGRGRAGNGRARSSVTMARIGWCGSRTRRGNRASRGRGGTRRRGERRRGSATMERATLLSVVRGGYEAGWALVPRAMDTLMA